jgi:adenylosuccinate lyase
MIPRYSRPEMVAIWSPETKFRIWFEIEAHACDAMAELGVIPKANAEAVWRAKDVTFDVARIDEIEAVTKHDVIAFLTHLAEIVGADEARFVHQGMTSSDVLDTTFNIQLARAADLLLADLDALLAALKRRAFEHKMTVRIGRSHGIHAEPTTMGLTFARFYAEMQRNRARLENARKEIATGAISGAVGTFANIDPARRGACLPDDGPRARTDLDAGHPPRPPRDVLRHPRRHRLVHRERGDRDPPHAAHRGAGGRGVSSRPARRAPRPCRTSATRC